METSSSVEGMVLHGGSKLEENETTEADLFIIHDTAVCLHFRLDRLLSGAPNGNFREKICSEDDLRSRIFGTFVVKLLACLPLLGFSNIYKMV